LRAGASVVDIMGGTLGVVGILSALRERDLTGRGQRVKSALFETTIFLMAQHMAGSAVTGREVPPMPARRGAWGIYQAFDTADGSKVFVGVTSNNHWTRLCEALGRPDLLADERLATNEDRVKAKQWLTPMMAEIFGGYTREALTRLCEAAGIPFAPVAKVEDLFEDPHLLASGGLVDMLLPGGIQAKLPRLPLEVGEHAFDVRLMTPRLGEHTRAVLGEAGLPAAEIAELEGQGIIVTAAD
jgi:crotonobetainyl-CoA:carnitine CoA-transferase CaiB-like acyl-CoA transferase